MKRSKSDGAMEGSSPALLSLAAPLSAGLYAFMAISMAFFNKAVLTVHKFDHPNFLLLLQMVVALLTVYALKTIGTLRLEPFTRQRARALAPVAILYNANVAFALASLSSLNIPMYNVLKRLTPCVVLAMGGLVDRKLPSRNVSLSVMVTVLGCVVAGIGDLAFDLKGYAFACMSCLLQSAYLLCVQKTGVEKGISSSTLLAYNALLSIPPLFVIAAATGELSTAITALRLPHSVGFWFALIMTVAGGMLLNYALFLCTLLNSALTTTIVGVLKGVIATALGFVLLGGVQATALNIAGVAMNTVGGVWYTYLTYREKKQRSKQAEKLEPAAEPLLQKRPNAHAAV
eukprot:jgi/Chlat1/5570/Chrsp369S05364